jgi:hypothetical protein
LTSVWRWHPRQHELCGSSESVAAPFPPDVVRCRCATRPGNAVSDTEPVAEGFQYSVHAPPYFCRWVCRRGSS